MSAPLNGDPPDPPRRIRGKNPFPTTGSLICSEAGVGSAKEREWIPLTTDKIRVVITNAQKSFRIPTGLRMLIRRSCIAVLRNEQFPGPAEISVTFVNNEEIRKLNAQYRDKDTPTDVLSFPMGVNGEYDINLDTGAKILGDVVLSVEKAAEQAELYGHGLDREVGYLTVHSVLHLLGYDHIDPLDKVHMREKEESIMHQLGLDVRLGYTAQ